MEKQRVLLYGNCQGGWLANALLKTPAISARYELTYLSDYTERPKDHPIHSPDFLPSCSCVIWQTASGCKPPDFLAGIATGCRQIRYPTLWLQLLWPTYAVDPRNLPEPGFPWGRYPYGDRLVMKLLAAGVPPEDVPKRYSETDLNTIVNLERFTEMSLAAMRFNDKQSDIVIAPFIERTFRKRKLFGAVNHPTQLILTQLYHGLVAALLEEPLASEHPIPANASDTLGTEEIPLHPQIISHHQLEWAQPGMKWRYHSEFLDLPEYIHAYAAWRPIPMGEPPVLWLARARQAADQHDFTDAERLLLEGTVKFPGVVQFLQFLGLMRLHQNRLEDAEKVFRYALSVHPTVADLHFKLGVTLFRRHFKAEARLSFEATLKIEPTHAEALRHLAWTTQPATAMARSR
jgi:tetratricopeptide (TPR) repeat protein